MHDYHHQTKPTPPTRPALRHLQVSVLSRLTSKSPGLVQPTPLSMGGNITYASRQRPRRSRAAMPSSEWTNQPLHPSSAVVQARVPRSWALCTQPQRIYTSSQTTNLASSFIAVEQHYPPTTLYYHISPHSTFIPLAEVVPPLSPIQPTLVNDVPTERAKHHYGTRNS